MRLHPWCVLGVPLPPEHEPDLKQGGLSGSLIWFEGGLKASGTRRVDMCDPGQEPEREERQTRPVTLQCLRQSVASTAAFKWGDDRPIIGCSFAP